MESVTSAMAASPEASVVDSHKEEIKALLAQARNVKSMLEDFKAGIEGCTFSGHVAVRIAIGLQWLESMLRQNKNDIERLQGELNAK